MAGRASFDKFLSLGVFVFVLLLCLVHVWETDTWWHLKAGQVIAETQGIPKTDDFSFTRAGQPWLNDEWLGDMYLFGMYQRHGVKGLILFTAIIGAAIFYLALGVGKLRGASLAALAPLLALAAVAARLRLSPRPEILSLLFFSLILYLLSKFMAADRNNTRSTKFLWLAPVFQMLWVNTHPSGLMGILLILLAMLCGVAAFFFRHVFRVSFLEFTPEIDSARLRKLGAVLVVSLFASLLNPYGAHALTAPFEFAGTSIYLKHLLEWAPIPTYQLFTPLAGDAQVRCFKALACLGSLGILLRVRRLNLFDTALFLGTLFMALTSRRFFGLFAVAATPGIAANLSLFVRDALLPGAGRFLNLIRMPVRAAALIFLVAFGYAHIFKDTRFDFGFGVQSRVFPDAALEFVKEHHIQGRMFNDYALGGYIIWKLYPENKVFIDGRTTFYGPDFYKRYITFEANPTPRIWAQAEKAWGLDFAILSSRSDHQRLIFDAIMTSSKNWRLVYWDDRALVLVKKLPKFQDLLWDHDYRLTNPYTALWAAYRFNEYLPYMRDEIIDELKQNLKQCPDNGLALAALAYIEKSKGHYTEARRLALTGRRVRPADAIFPLLLSGMAQELNRPKEAKRFSQEADRLISCDDQRFAEYCKNRKAPRK